MGFWEKIDKTGERIDIYEKIKRIIHHYIYTAQVIWQKTY